MPGLGYPLYEITSSGMNSARGHGGEPNRHRVGEGPLRVDNWGLLDIDWDTPDPRLRVEIRGVEGEPLRVLELRLSKLGVRR